MRPARTRVCALVASLLLTPAASADEPYVPHGYAADVGQVYGTLRGVRQMVDICAGAFPASAPDNRAAFRRWRERYRPFLDEMESRYQGAIAAATGHDEASYRAAMAQIERGFVRRTESTRAELLAANAAGLESECGGFARVLDSEAVDFERMQAAKVRKIRAADVAWP